MAPVPILSVQVHHKRGGPSIQHINFLKAIDPSRFAMHVLVVQSHEMREQYDQVAASVITMPHMPTIPRSKSPLFDCSLLCSDKNHGETNCPSGKRR